MLYVLEYMECNDWLLFCQKACFLQGKNIRGEELLLKNPTCDEMRLLQPFFAWLQSCMFTWDTSVLSGVVLLLKLMLLKQATI